MTSHVDPRRRRTGVSLDRVGNALLTVTAVLGSICIVATIAAVVLDVRPLVFRSGSMEPAISTGALALARTTDADDLSAGDVVSVTGAEGERVTHRIESVTVRDGVATLVLRGDANATPDGEPYVVETADRVFADVPYAGYVVAWTSGPAGVFLGGLLLGGIALSAIRSATGHRSGGARRATVVLGVLAIGAGAAPRVGPVSTAAAFTDSATMSSGTLSSYKVPSTTLTCAVVNGIQIRLSWTAVPGATSYTVTSGAVSVPVTAPTTSYTFTPLVASGTATVVANRAFGSPVTTTWTSASSNVVGFAALVGTQCT